MASNNDLKTTASSSQPSSVPHGDIVDGTSQSQHAETARLVPLESVGLDEARPAPATQTAPTTAPQKTASEPATQAQDDKEVLY